MRGFGGHTARRLALALCLLSGASSSCSVDEASTPEAAGEARPVPQLVILISIDTLRPDHLGFYGHERFTSPVLDTLALEGVVFDDASSTASWTLPAHASMLTGLFPLSHRVVSVRTRLPNEVPTLASMLADAGWDTAAAVSVAWLKKESYAVTRDFDKYLWTPGTLGRQSVNSWVTDQVIDWIDGLGEAPLFVFAHYYDLHSDYLSHPSFEKLFLTPYEGPVDGTGWQLKQIMLPDAYVESCKENFDPKRCSFSAEFVVGEATVKVKLGPDDVRRLEELYDAQIRQLDTDLARLFSALRGRGLMDKTLLIITSDHGEEFMEHRGVEHFSTAYQETIRIPLLMRGPGIPQGLRVSAPVSIVDIVPTALAAVGVEAPKGLEGLDLAPLWSAGETRLYRDRHLFTEAAGGISKNYRAGEYHPIYRSVRQGRHKLIVESKKSAHALYDLTTDPFEQEDISAQEPEITARLLAVAEARFSALERALGGKNRVDLDPEDAARLRALGYAP